MSLVTKAGGFVFTRVYFTEEGFDLGDGKGRPVLGQRLLGVDYDPQRGLDMHFTDYECHVPPGLLSASWKPSRTA